MRAFFALGFLGFVVLGLHACTDDSGGASSSGGASGTSGGSSGNSSGGTSGASGTSGGTPVVPSKVNTTPQTVDVDGISRNYVLSIPKTYDAARSYPLILALHGDGQDANGFVGFLGLDVQTGDDAILAYPDHSEDLFTAYEDNTDQKMLERIIDAVKAKYTIDAAKVWGLGYSKGAYQLNEIACKKPGMLKAMAIHAGGAPQTRNPDESVNCPSAIALPAFVTHGALDDPNGGKFGAEYWAGLAGCGGEPTTPTSPAICKAFDGCEAGKPVVFCVVPDQPHFPLYKDAAAHSWAWFKTL